MKTVAYEKVGLAEQTEYANPQRWELLQNDFRINAFGIHELMPPVSIRRPEGTGDWLFILFHDEAWVVLSDERITVPSGTLMLWPHGAAHHYGQENAGKWEHTWIHFDGSWAAEKIRECGIGPGSMRRLGQPQTMETCLWQLHAELTRNLHPDPVILKNTFHNWLRELMRDSREGTPAHIPGKIREVRQYLDQHASHAISLRHLAGKAGMSASHLSAEFRRYYHDSPINYLIGLRLKQARYLLLDSSLSIGEAASRVGYDDIHHFSKLFKKHFGVSPGQIRKRIS